MISWLLSLFGSPPPPPPPPHYIHSHRVRDTAIYNNVVLYLNFLLKFSRNFFQVRHSYHKDKILPVQWTMTTIQLVQRRLYYTKHKSGIWISRISCLWKEFSSRMFSVILEYKVHFNYNFSCLFVLLWIKPLQQLTY